MKILKKLFIMLFVIFSSPIFAGKYPVLFVNNTKVTSGPAYTPDITLQIVEIGPAADVVLPAYYTIIAGISDSDGQYNIFPPTFFSAGPSLRADGVRTVGELATQLAQSTFGQRVYSSDMQRYCVGYGYYDSTSDYGASYAPYFSAMHFPAGCTQGPPPYFSCKITTPEIILDHGSLNLNNVEGSVSRSNVGVECTTETDVAFTLATGDDYIYLAPTGKSKINVNNQPLGSITYLLAGTNQVPISDELSGVAVEGVNSGSGVLVMMPY
ncbi:MrpH family fimbial adhesin [Cronobacter dublinensis]|uniref:MrpH family fimbial adhesin n=1 Tax=Cronobacter dublinensis TaxID=413497 RepID=UPI00131A0720|nr:hypothetical protein [Cronobacter dublinensis]